MSADYGALVAVDPLLESAQRLIREWSADEWWTADPDSTSEADQFTLGRMVEIGVMRRRDTAIVTCPGQRGQVRAVVSSVGDVSGDDRRGELADAATEVMPRAWYFRDGRHRSADFDWQPVEYRLTSEGELAQADVRGGNELLYLELLMSSTDGKPHTVPGKISVVERTFTESGGHQGGGIFATLFAKIGTFHIGNNYNTFNTTTTPTSPAADPPSPKAGPADSVGRRSPANVNDRMRSDLEGDHTLVTLSAQRWADRLGCSKAAVVGTEMWKTIQARREAAKKQANLSGTVDPDEPLD